jgi:3-oxoacyl-[acyl-carrier protein] reductase
MTKSAIAGLTRGLARDLGPRGITVNNVQPGPTETDGNPADGPDAAKAVALSAIGRFGHPDEVAAMVAYLATPEAALVTAASLTIDGGLVA